MSNNMKIFHFHLPYIFASQIVIYLFIYLFLQSTMVLLFAILRNLDAF